MTSLTSTYSSSMLRTALSNYKVEIEGQLPKLQVQLSQLHIKTKLPKLRLQIPPPYGYTERTPSPRERYPCAPSTPTFQLPPLFYSRPDRLAQSRLYAYSTDQVWLESIFPASVQSKLSVVLVDNRQACDLEITVLGGLVYFDQHNSLVARHLGTRMRRSVRADDIEAIRAIVKASSHFYHHLTRGSPRHFGGVWMELNNLVEMVTEESDVMFKPIGRNLIAEEPATIVVDPYAALGITIHNDSDRALYPYLFYFDPMELTINEWYLPGTHGLTTAPLRPRSILAIGQGVGDNAPWSFVLPSADVKLDLGFFRLFLSTRPASFESIVQESRSSFLLQDEDWSVQTVTLIQVDA